MTKDYSLAARIAFYSLDQVHVDLTSDSLPEDQLFAEQLLYCCMALRQLANMGGRGPAKRLEQFLVSVANHPFDILQSGQDRGIRLVTKRDKRPEIIFPPELKMEDGVLAFTVRLRRSTLFKRRLYHYAVASVIVLYYFLGDRRRGDSLYLRQLSLVSGLCAYSFHSGQLTVRNQLEGAFQIVTEVMSGKHTDLESKLKQYREDA